MPMLGNRALSRVHYLGMSLSPTEQKIVNELCTTGFSNKAIGDKLNIAEGTVKTHLTFVFDKIGCTTRSELMAKLWQKKYDKLKGEYDSLHKMVA